MEKDNWWENDPEYNELRDEMYAEQQESYRDNRDEGQVVIDHDRQMAARYWR